MAELGSFGGIRRFRDPGTGRFISGREASTRGGFVESFAPGGGLQSRTTLADATVGEQFNREDKPNSTLITRDAGAGDNWLQFVEPPFDRDVTEFRFVVEDPGYDSGFRTTAPFSADESPFDVAERLGITPQVVRIVYGIAE